MGLSTANQFRNVNSDKLILVEGDNFVKLRKIILDILKDIDKICREENIPYTLGGGSVLGAVRHKGFIPWDDDIDMNLTRENYYRFVEAFRKRNIDKYVLQTPEDTDGYEVLFARVRLKGTVVRNRDDLHSSECGACVDIFIIENTYSNFILRGVHGVVSNILAMGLSCRKFYENRKFLLDFSKDQPEMKTSIKTKVFLGFFLSLLTLNKWRRINIKWNTICRNNDSKFVTIPAGRNRFFGEIYLRENVCKSVSCRFEDMDSFIPQNADYYLKKLYGNYMEIPPEDKREKHMVFELKL